MSMRINGELVETISEYFTVRRKSSDGEVVEIAFESQELAELDQRFYGGELRVRTAYIMISRPVKTDFPAEMPTA